ncbi:hypothetical protein [Emcibacter sp. SYSU 3D8]|uniref:hypothetical protein n=1 Tax=Emcibacter sp. SYSU 3D8 TaxID=3133969 RepID=UPI0031FE6628
MASPQDNPAQGFTVKKVVLLGTGWMLVIAGPIIGILPGPGGIPVAAAGLVIILSQSYTAKRMFIRMEHRYPRFLRPLRRFIRRGKPAKQARADKPAST